MAIEKITGIVTDIIKYSDRHNIVTLFTRERGRLPLLSAAGNGKTARIRNASLMHLSLISADININTNRELQFLGRFQRETLWKDLYFNPMKSAIAMFIAEFVNNYNRFSGPDPRLWDFLAESIRTLDESKSGLPNFHLGFLVEFMSYAGIKPDMSEWRQDAWFDMRDGTMTIFPPTHREILTPSESVILPLLSRLNVRTARVFKFNGQQRRELLKKILHYYSLHFPGIGSLKSPEVLAEVFS